jgi:hypothetical protein
MASSFVLHSLCNSQYSQECIVKKKAPIRSSAEAFSMGVIAENIDVVVCL